MKGLFIPDITAEMFRNASLEGIEALMEEGALYDIQYNPKQRWIPCSERLPEQDTTEDDEMLYLCTYVVSIGNKKVDTFLFDAEAKEWFFYQDGWGNYDWNEDIVAWMPLPTPYKEEE